MSDLHPQSGASVGIVERVQNILLKPQSEWDKIEAEPANIQSLFMTYALPLVAIGAVAAVIGQVTFGMPGGYGYYSRIGIAPALVGGVLALGLGLASVFILGHIINALAPSFGSQQELGQSMKLAVYSSTAAWVAAVLQIVPMLGILAIFGSIYSLVLLYIGMPRLMKTPEDKRIGYFLVTLLISIAVGFAAVWIMAMMMLSLRFAF